MIDCRECRHYKTKPGHRPHCALAPTCKDTILGPLFGYERMNDPYCDGCDYFEQKSNCDMCNNLEEVKKTLHGRTHIVKVCKLCTLAYVCRAENFDNCDHYELRK